MNAAEFSRKWRASKLKERSAAQEHFLDLCTLLNVPHPGKADPAGTWFCFERGVKKTGGGAGWADVWRRNCFAWEYKGKHNDLTAAFAQLQRYAIALENPPLLVVSDMERICIHTNFTNTVSQVHEISLDDLSSPVSLQKLRWLFLNPEKLRPGQTSDGLTQDAANTFAEVAHKLRRRKTSPERVAHFLNRILFCLFAQHAGLLPRDLVTQLLRSAAAAPEQAAVMMKALFSAMKTGGSFGAHVIHWFNGNLFDSNDALRLEADEIGALIGVAELDWSAIEPSIFGTLFERGLNPRKGPQIGAHFTDRDSILRIVGPVISTPLYEQWANIKSEIERLPPGDTSSIALARDFLRQLSDFRVLDPACGSGNFLYVALQQLKDVEHRVRLDAETLGVELVDDRVVGVQNLRGIELNEYAAELARVTVWIGEIQWMLQHGVAPSRNPILKPLATIECRDALLDEEREAKWPESTCVVGNPPFLGDKKMIRELGERYVRRLRRAYAGRVPGGADLVMYWFERARAELNRGHLLAGGLVATNSIRQGANRKVLESLMTSASVFEAWSDEPWINDGAAVRVSIVCFDSGQAKQRRLNGRPVSTIHSDLRDAATDRTAVDLTRAKRLPENVGYSFFGLCLAGPFAVQGSLARSWLRHANPNRRPNSDVLRPIYNGIDITRRPQDRWVIDFGTDMTREAAAQYEAPFEYVVKHVRPGRLKNRERSRAVNWWRLGRPRPELRAALTGLGRYIVTPETAKHRFFAWLPAAVAPEHKLVVIPREDDLMLGLLSSRFHRVWASAMGATLEDRPVYTSSSCFETYPFPPGMTPGEGAAKGIISESIAAAAKNLDSLRNAWLHPLEWTHAVPEDVAGYPERVIARDGYEEDLRTRTLTALYNAMPEWLTQAHSALDASVAKAYGWRDYSASWSDEQILDRLLRLNGARQPDLADLADNANARAETPITPRPEERFTSSMPEVLRRRVALAATIVDRLSADPNLGRTKLAKVFYLADVSLRLQLRTKYYREAAGPFDATAFYRVERAAAQLQCFATDDSRRSVRYTRLQRLSETLATSSDLLDGQVAEIHRLIDLFRPLSTEQAEIVATLYACWNDRLLGGEPCGDGEIIGEFLHKWHDRKRRFPRQRLVKALSWMRDSNVIPKGVGAKTLQRRG